MKFSLFRRTQHKTFNHIPIYYNEKEDRIKEMERQAQIEMQEQKGQKPADDAGYRDRIKGSMRRYDHQHQSAVHFASNQRKKSNLRVFFLIVILLMVAYLLWTHTDTFIQAFLSR